jgi:DNA-directed RNA polymerase subunit RPC12/RpoP
MQVTIAKSENFEVRSVIDSNLGEVHLCFVGDLTEEANLDEVASYLGRVAIDIQSITLDLERIRTLNSAGVRLWMQFVEALPRQTAVFFYRVSEPLVDQANLVPHLLGSSRKSVRSFFAPYVCSDCTTRSQIEIGVEADLTRVRTRKCPRCGKEAELDGLVESYFGFLKQLKD